jgi:hypothetical protein
LFRSARRGQFDLYMLFIEQALKRGGPQKLDQRRRETRERCGRRFPAFLLRASVERSPA